MMTDKSPEITIVLTPEDGDDLDNDWQNDCQKFSQILNENIQSLDDNCEVSAQNRTTEIVDGVDTRGIDLPTFSSLALTLGGSSIAANTSDLIFSSLKDWLSTRKGSNCTIVGADGSKYNFNNMTNDELFKLMEKTRITD